MSSWNPNTLFSGLRPRFGGEAEPAGDVAEGTASGPDPEPAGSAHFPQPQGRPFGFADVRAQAGDPDETAHDDDVVHDEVVEASFTPGSAEAAEVDEQSGGDAWPHGPVAEHADDPDHREQGDRAPQAEVVPLPVHEAPREKRSRVPRSSNRGSGRGRRVVGLKIGASQVAAAVASHRDGAHVLHEVARTPLERGIVVDGEVKDAAALTTALKEFFAEHKLPTRDVVLGLASNRIGVRTFDIVGVDDPARLDNAVRFKAHEVLPVAVHESVLDYRVLSTTPGEAGESTKRVLLVVAPRDQVQPYADACSAAGLRLAGMDLEALGLLRTFIDPASTRVPGTEDRATVVISIGYEASTLLVAGGGVAEFARVFDWGGSQLVDALAQELSTGADEAEAVLRRMSLSGGSARPVDGLDEETRATAYDAVRLRLTPFARELVSSLQFYQTQPDSLGIGEIVITGGTSHLQGLDEALNQIIGVPVRVGNPLARVVVEGRIESADEEQIGSLAVPIGLALEDGKVRGVNLLPRDADAPKRVSTGGLAKVLVPAAAAVPLVAMAFLFVQARNDVSAKEETLAAKEAEFVALPKPTKPVLEAGVGADQQARATALSLVMGGRTAWDGVLRDVAKILPGDVWLTNLKATAPVVQGDAAAAAAAPPATTGGPVAPTGVNIVGYTYKQDDVAELLARLSALPRLENVQLSGATLAKVAEKDVIQFTILADLAEAGGS